MKAVVADVDVVAALTVFIPLADAYVLWLLLLFWFHYAEVNGASLPRCKWKILIKSLDHVKRTRSTGGNSIDSVLIL